MSPSSKRSALSRGALKQGLGRPKLCPPGIPPIPRSRGFAKPRPFGFQPAGSDRFVGRVPELWAVNDGLKRSANPMLSGVVRSIVQIRGLGGTCKSLLAEEYVLRFGAGFPGGIFWLKAFGSD